MFRMWTYILDGHNSTTKKLLEIEIGNVNKPRFIVTIRQQPYFSYTFW